ncbi:hypothetical protein DU002_01305 [Corallincola holothuriorum]|uniref:Big-1 domain-containing protein n=1 Tax=Corallincola holothuriorum TaxID=2282215 RepID=A0A368NR52_9GAMM|nr:hypothetical protein [Corallincola holothuriorum]RCU52636.1 hypothetical protein DU002_01305 [Corallincola holothuriorum]
MFSCIKNYRHGLLALCAAAMLFMATVPSYASSSLDFFQTRPKVAYVFARTVVLDDNGEAILVEYNDDGSEAGVVNLPVPVSEAVIVSAAEYRAEQLKLSLFMQEHKTGLAKQARLITRANYDTEAFLAADNKTEINKPSLNGAVKSVLVRGQADLLPGANNLVLQTFTVNLAQPVTLGDNISSLALDQNGNVLDMRVGSIAPRSRFFAEDVDQTEQPGYYDRRKHTPYGGVPGIPIVNLSIYTSYALTGELGHAGYVKFLGYCSPLGMEVNGLVTATVPYSGFVHNGAAALPFFMQSYDYDYCMGVPNLGASLIGKMVEINIAAILATTAIPVGKSHFYIDVMMLSGQVNLANPDGSPVSIGDVTKYKAHSPETDPVGQAYYDFDADGVADRTELGVIKTKTNDDGEEVEFFTTALEQGQEATHQGVYLSSGSAPAGEPDFVRLADKQKNFASTGYLESISKDDLTNTDILVFRESTGELVVARRGLSDAESGNSKTGLTKDDTFYYRMAMRGGRNSLNNVGAGKKFNERYDDWATRNGFADAFKERKSNLLKPGEWVKLVVINRATGYMATQRVELKNLTQGSVVPQITLTPPNLKIWAERKYKVEQGLTAGKDRKYLIGAEGAGLTSDSEIKVFTEWFDHDGSPLPAGLAEDDGEMYGMTGRLAKIVGPDMLAAVADSDLANFPIAPGRNTQVVQVKEDGARPEHYYIHVVGTQKDENPSFEQTGAGEGALATRPAKLTPFLTPLYDEAGDDLQWLSYNQLKKEYEEAEDPADLIEPNSPTPSYAWRYRPEYQYSRFGFEVEKIRASDEDEVRVEDLLSGNHPVLTSLDELVEFLYSLNGAAAPRLAPIDGEQTMVLALGESEVELSFDDSGAVKFSESSLSHLSSLEVEDYLTMRLYLNEDAANTLWELAFDYLLIDTEYAGYDASSGETFYVSADNPAVPLSALLIGYASRDESLKQPMPLQWKLEGSGSMKAPVTINGDGGVFENVVLLPSVTGASAVVTVESLDDEAVNAKLPPIEVVPGKVARVEYSLDGALSVSGAEQLKISVTAYDAHNNLVPGANVSSFIEGSILELSADLKTNESAKANLLLTGGESSGPGSIRITVDQFELNVPLEVRPLTVEFVNTFDEIYPSNSAVVTSLITTVDGAPVKDVYVDFSTTYGYLEEGYVKTDNSGIARIKYTAPLSPREGIITARVGYTSGVAHPIVVKDNPSTPKAVESNYASFVGDKTTDGAINNVRADGTVVQVAYKTNDQVAVSGKAGETVIVNLGDDLAPNQMPLAAYSMSGFDGGSLADDTGHYPLTAEYISAVNGSSMGAGRSLKLRGTFSNDFGEFSSRLTAPTVPVLLSGEDFSFNFEMSPNESVGNLLDLGHGAHQVNLLPDSTIEYTVTTEDGVFSVTSAPITLNNWHSVSVQWHRDTIRLVVGSQVSEQAVTGQPKVGAPEDEFDPQLSIGFGFVGELNFIRFFGGASAPLVTFADGRTVAEVSFVESGSQQLTIVSTGQMNSAGENVPVQRIALKTPINRQYVSLLSTPAFTYMAGQMVEMDKSLPALDFAKADERFKSLIDGKLASPLYSEFIPVAHAGWLTDFVWDAVNFFLPIEDLNIVVTQLGYLATDPEKFDAVELLLSSINVITVIPVAKPLKLVTGPAKAVMRHLRKLNPRIAKIMGEYVGVVVKQAKDGKFDNLANLLPFFLIMVEMFEDDEARAGMEFMLGTLVSADDLLSWMSYLSLPAEGWNGDGEPNPDDIEISSVSHTVPSLWGIEQAYAKKRSRISGAILGKMLGKLSKRLIGKELKSVPQALKHIRKALLDTKHPEIRAKILSRDFVSGAVRVTVRNGSTAVRNLIRGKTNMRFSPTMFMAITSYLTWESSCGMLLEGEPGDAAALGCDMGRDEGDFVGLNENVRKEIALMYGKLFADGATGVGRDKFEEEDPNIDVDLIPKSAMELKRLWGGGHGIAFHLSQIAYYQLLHRSLGGKAILAVEAPRAIAFFNDEDDIGNLKGKLSCGQGKKCLLRKRRFIDIVLDGGKNDEGAPQEHWVELKSYAARGEKGANRAIASVGKLQLWHMNKTKAGNYASNGTGTGTQGVHRQFSLDRVAAHLGKSWKASGILWENPDPLVVTDLRLVSDYEWRFQAFNVKDKASGKSDVSVKLGGVGQVNTAWWVGARLPTNITSDVAEANFGTRKLKGTDRSSARKMRSINQATIAAEILKLGMGDLLKDYAQEYVEEEILD